MVEAQPKADNGNRRCEKLKNRRVELVIVANEALQRSAYKSQA